jgi:hypothetical membrane protein
MRRSLELLGAACGIAGPVAFLVLYGTAMAIDRDYVFFRDYLSDLGVSAGAWAFNSAVIAAGALTVAFAALGIWPAFRAWRWTWGGPAMLMVGGAFLVAVGIFTEDARPAHYIVSVSFFMSVLVGLGLLALAMWRTGALGSVAAAVTGAAFVLGLLMLLFGFDPRTETVAVIAEVFWGLAIALVRLRQLLSSRVFPAAAAAPDTPTD